MAALELIQHMVPYLGELMSWHNLAHHGLLWPLSTEWSLFDWNLANQGIVAALLETDVFKPVRTFFDYFIKSGQVWALLIGSIVGYLFRSLTSYG